MGGGALVRENDRGGSGMHFFNLIDLYRMQKRQWESPSIVSELQNIKLQKLICHAYQNVPYYHQLFNSVKISPRDIKTTGDLYKLPLTSKEHIKSLPIKDVVARGIDLKKCRCTVTSGTTGIPLRTYFTLRDTTLMNLSWIRAFVASGMKPWDKIAAFVGRQPIERKKSWYEHLGFFRRKEISTWNEPEDWIEEINKWKPEILTGYVMTLRILGEAIEKYQIKSLKPKKIFHSSALLDDFSRRYLESVFQRKIVDFYGSDEGGCIAWECEKCSGYHICSDMVIVEILKDGRPVSSGEEGEVVITNLRSYAMPFIRYKQDDVVMVSSKKPVCGRKFPLIERIQGRTDDFIVLKNGRKLSPHPFYHSIDPVLGIKRWRIIQENIYTLTVEIEPALGFDEKAQRSIKQNLRKLVGDEMTINILLVDSISISPSLKFRAVSSRLGI